MNVIQPIKSIVLHIRSKDAEQITNGFNTHFRVSLKDPIHIEPTEEVHVFMSSAEIPYSFYPISQELSNNTLYYNTNSVLTLPSQNYTPSELLRQINLNTNFSDLFTTTYNKFTNKITILNKTNQTQVINWTLSNLNKILGFESKTADDTLLSNESTTSPDMLNLASVHSIIIHSSLSQANVLSTRAGNSTTLQKMSVDVNAYQIIYLNEDDFRTYSVTNQPVIDLIEFRLTDQNNNLLQLNNLSFEMSLIFNTYPKYNDTPPYQYSGMNQQQLENRQRRNIIQQNPLSMPPNISTPLTRAEPPKTIDDTHPIEGLTEIEDDSKKIILDELLNQYGGI